eukprot:1081723-Prymnesium_polylepis.1
MQQRAARVARREAGGRLHVGGDAVAAEARGLGAAVPVEDAHERMLAAQCNQHLILLVAAAALVRVRPDRILRRPRRAQWRARRRARGRRHCHLLRLLLGE